MQKYLLFLTFIFISIGALSQEQKDSLLVDSIAMAKDTVVVVKDSTIVTEDSLRIAEATEEHIVKDTVVGDKKTIKQTVT
jgi:hypothetical protein